MKGITLFVLLNLYLTLVRAQGLDSIIVERYYVSDAEDQSFSVSDETNPLPVGSVTWRFFVDMKPGYNVQTVYGNASHPLNVTTTTGFFNNVDYGSERPVYSANNAKKGTTMLDSWLTMGSACAGSLYWGVLKTEDNDTPFTNSKNILRNSDPTAGIPLTIQDGLLLSSGVPAASFIGDVPISIFSDGIPDTDFVIRNGAWYFLGGVIGPTENNRVLIAQVTTDGTITYNLNILIGKDLGGGNSLSEKYVYSNPVDDEISGSQYKLSGTLKPFIYPPSVSITTPADNAHFSTGDTVTISVFAEDTDGNIIKVEFYRNGTKIGEDTSGVDGFSVNWIAGAGSSVFTAVATDNDLNLTVSSAVNILVTDPGVIFPIVSLVLPSPGAVLLYNTPCLVAANAGDADGSITGVEFFADDLSIGIDSTGFLSYSISWIPMDTGQVNITAKATDNDFNTTTSLPMTVIVHNPVFTDNTIESSIEVFPNPSCGIFYLTSPFDARLELIDTRGKILWSEQALICGINKEINASWLADGLYILKLVNKESTIYRKLIIKK